MTIVASTDFLLGRLGFDLSQIEYAPNDDIPTFVRSTTPVGVRAHIMTRTIDPFGRPVAFVFAENAPEQSGSIIFLEVPRLDQSLNAELMRQGHVYPGFYSAREVDGERVGGLPGDLRIHLAELARDAFDADRGLWPSDETTDGAIVSQDDDLAELAIWPKLYRRLAKYFDDPDANTGDLQGFIEWLHEDRADRDDLIFVLSIGELLNLSDIVTVEG